MMGDVGMVSGAGWLAFGKGKYYYIIILSTLPPPKVWGREGFPLTSFLSFSLKRSWTSSNYLLIPFSYSSSAHLCSIHDTTHIRLPRARVIVSIVPDPAFLCSQSPRVPRQPLYYLFIFLMVMVDGNVDMT